MKKAVLHFSPFVFYLCLSAFICGCFSSVSYASSPYEDMRARNSLYAATKQALNLNEGHDLHHRVWLDTFDEARGCKHN